MDTLIIGHRGFVGSNLSHQFPGSFCAGRAEIGSLAGTTYNQIYCAAPQAKKWWANQNPEKDKLEIESLIRAVSQIGCRDIFILFSTVDVYDPARDVDELDVPPEKAHPYGRNRRMLEKAIIELFGEKARILRLPALVGKGLKKNVIYDLLNNNNVEAINPNSSFQWFSLDYLSLVMGRMHDLSVEQVLNVASEPIKTSAIVDQWFTSSRARLNWDLPRIGYDVQTIYGSHGSRYLISASDIMNLHLRPFIEEYSPV